VKKFIKFGIVSAAIMAVQLAPVTTTYAGPIEDRQEAMKSVGKSMKALAGMFKGVDEFSGESAESHGKNILTSFETAQKLFTNGEEVKGSSAKATIWSDADGFSAVFEKGKAGAKAVEAAGSEFDEDAFKAAFKQLAGGCKSCHEGFRLPKE